MRLSKKKKEAYLKDTNFCPRCRKGIFVYSNLSGDLFPYAGKLVLRKDGTISEIQVRVKCDHCSGAFKEIYTLTDVKGIR